MAEREVYNEDTGQYEFANDGRVDTPYTPPEEPYTGMDMSAEQIAAYNAANPLPAGQRWTWNRYNWVVEGTPEQTPTPPVLPNPDAADADERYRIAWNGGSPPAIQLKPNHGWEFDRNAVAWKQVEGRGIGWSATAGGPPRTPGPSGPKPAAPYTGPSGGIPGVPSSYAAAAPRAAYSGPAMPTGPVPTLASAMESAKQLKSAPTVNPYEAFAAPQEVGKAERDRLIQSILGNPQTMGQTQQDQLFEQQKEQQRQMGEQARNRLSQSTAGRGLSAGGGAQLAGEVKLESGFIDALMAGRRDISVKATEINRQNELAAIEMSNAVNSGDFARAQSAYETQLNAKKAYDELRFRAAEFDRSNVALAAQTDMASRQQQGTEAMASFQQYMDQLKFDELMRQFNEQMALDYGKFGWTQQMNLANLFP